MEKRSCKNNDSAVARKIDGDVHKHEIMSDLLENGFTCSDYGEFATATTTDDSNVHSDDDFSMNSVALNIGRKRYRGRNFTPQERNVLFDLVSSSKYILDNNKKNDATTSCMKDQEWVLIAEAFTKFTGSNRSLKQLQNAWANSRKEPRQRKIPKHDKNRNGNTSSHSLESAQVICANKTHGSLPDDRIHQLHWQRQANGHQPLSSSSSLRKTIDDVSARMSRYTSKNVNPNASLILARIAAVKASTTLSRDRTRREEELHQANLTKIDLENEKLRMENQLLKIELESKNNK